MTALFTIISILTLAAAAGVVLNRNAVASALSFFVCLCGISMLFVTLDAYLLAFLLILVYAGAVVALFLFIIMLLDMHGGDRRPFKKMTIATSLIAAALLALGVATFLIQGHIPAADASGASVSASSYAAASAAPALAQAPAFFTDLKIYGAKLFTAYMLPVQLVGFLLLVAMLGVIVISKHNEEKSETGGQAANEH